METLFQTKGEILLGTCFVGWLFYALGWFLDRPFFTTFVETQVKKITHVKDKRLEELISGIHVRVVGTVHNTLQVTLALWALMDPVLWNNTWHGVTGLSQLVLIISAGFFLWDIAAAIRRVAVDGVDFIVHGVLCFAFYFYVASSSNFHFYGCSFLLWEVSTPFVHLRWLLFKIGMKDSKLYLYNGVTMMIVFGMCRILWGGYLSLRFFVSSVSSQEDISTLTLWILRGICVVLNGLNWNWFSKMVSGAFKLLLKPKPVNGVMATDSVTKES